MAQVERSWTLNEIEEVGFQELRWRFVMTLEEAEVETAAWTKELKEMSSWWDPVIRRWGMVDHESALAYFLDRFYRASTDAVEEAEQSRFQGGISRSKEDVLAKRSWGVLDVR